ncbi:hypothetical protein PaeBR_06095 [Paenibacillus sp. BR2-3]|uniref:hypothetical protein n=1 Tax=Paenibacillus sp. BR2-3 TaxID=3048494 RepID=UPI003977806A
MARPVNQRAKFEMDLKGYAEPGREAERLPKSGSGRMGLRIYTASGKKAEE